MSADPPATAVGAQRFDAADAVVRGGYTLLGLELVLGAAHLVWPEFSWGQGRASLFNFANSLTLASWLAGMQQMVAAALALAAFHQDGNNKDGPNILIRYGWVGCALVFGVLSFIEFSRIHHRLHWWGFPSPNAFERMVVVPLGLFFLAAAGQFIRSKMLRRSHCQHLGYEWAAVWAGHLILAQLVPAAPPSLRPWITALVGITQLAGGTLLVMAVALYVLKQPVSPATRYRRLHRECSVFTTPHERIWVLSGLFVTAFSLLFLETVLLRTSKIFTDYLTAHTIISIALLGSGIGALVGLRSDKQFSHTTLLIAGIGQPLAVLLAFGTIVVLSRQPLFAALLLMSPFVCSGIIVTVALARMDVHGSYGVILVGAGLGALATIPLFGLLREEGCLLLLAACGWATAALFAIPLKNRHLRTLLLLPLITASVVFGTWAFKNSGFDWLNVIRTHIHTKNPAATVLFSRSSFISRYDIVRHGAAVGTLKAYENGRVVDTIRPLPVENYQIDPRLPHTLPDKPDILVIGLSGDGITKSARTVGDEVHGVEINPAVVALQRGELLPHNADSYAGIRVAVTDGRRYVAHSRRKFDIITLLNTHFARGSNAARAAGTEYLFTVEALNNFLDHLNDRGMLIVEEPVNRPAREVPVWKLLRSMRHVLQQNRHPHPERHFFIFQWKTKRNNYFHILMKKTPFTPADCVRLEQWLADVDTIREIGHRQGRRMGPITSAKTTILHHPYRDSAATVSQVVRGSVSPDLVNRHNLELITDNKPFMFDVDPSRTALKKAYGMTLVLALITVAMFVPTVLRRKSPLSRRWTQVLPHTLAVSLTGLGYILAEIVLIQRLQLFLGSATISVALVFGIMLIASGWGCIWSRNKTVPSTIQAVVAISCCLAAYYLGLSPFFAFAAGWPLVIKAVTSVVLVVPLGFFMGVPFPVLLKVSKTTAEPACAALLYGANAVAGALAVPLAFNLAATWGFQATLLAVVAVYGLVAALLWIIYRPRWLRPVMALSATSLAFFLAAPWIISQSVPVSPANLKNGPPNVYAVSYGESAFPAHKALMGAAESKKIAFNWQFWVIQSTSKTILVDVGFHDPKRARRWGIRNHVDPLEQLRKLKINPDDVSDIVLTHSHWDHMGRVSAFKRAQVWIQNREFEYARQRAQPTSRENFDTLLSIQRQGRLRLVDGTAKVAPGVSVRLAGGHTPGSQIITVASLPGNLIIAGDEAYLYRNHMAHIPGGNAYDTSANLNTLHELPRQAASPFLILPGHDPLVRRYFPEIDRGIYAIGYSAQ